MTPNYEKRNKEKLEEIKDFYKKFDRLNTIGNVVPSHNKTVFSSPLLEAIDDAWFLLQSLNNDDGSLALVDQLNSILAKHILEGLK